MALGAISTAGRASRWPVSAAGGAGLKDQHARAPRRRPHEDPTDQRGLIRKSEDDP